MGAGQSYLDLHTLSKIAADLPLEDLYNACKVNTQFAKACRSSDFWRAQIRSRFPKANLDDPELSALRDNPREQLRILELRSRIKQYTVEFKGDFNAILFGEVDRLACDEVNIEKVRLSKESDSQDSTILDGQKIVDLYGSPGQRVWLAYAIVFFTGDASVTIKQFETEGDAKTQLVEVIKTDIGNLIGEADEMERLILEDGCYLFDDDLDSYLYKIESAILSD